MISDELKSEVIRQYRVIDQTMTAHCILKERYDRRAKFLDIAILVMSAILLTTVFLDEKIVQFLGINNMAVRIYLGILTLLVFCLSIIQISVDWKKRSEQHQKAFEILNQYKPKYRIMKKDINVDDESCKKIIDEYNLATSFICSIPEGDFVKLKSKHTKKVLLSKLVSKNPSKSVFVLKAYLFWKGNWRKLKV